MNLNKKLLGETLTQAERMYLKQMSFHDGFPVLQKLFSEACQEATEDIVKLDPEDDKYDTNLKYRQQRARIINEFCGAIRKSFEANVMIGTQEEEKEKSRSKPNERNNSATN